MTSEQQKPDDQQKSTPAANPASSPQQNQGSPKPSNDKPGSAQQQK